MVMTVAAIKQLASAVDSKLSSALLATMYRRTDNTRSHICRTFALTCDLLVDSWILSVAYTKQAIQIFMVD